ncbi:MAG: hypothetical protein CVT64_09390 [Actinobacteria bacterium HGW-Actinobacteria-4]|nr:MAG: hypothetical protein CVT64_09390 [Actinobacteria bacterium HGW-Actinobacteria-4]
MSTTPEPTREAAFFAAIRQWGITRGPNGVVGGVVEGIGERVGMARVPARIIVVVAALLLPGVVLLGYAGAWGLLPDREGNIIIQNFGRGVTNVGALIGIGVLVLLGLGGLGETRFVWPGIPRGSMNWDVNSAPEGLALAVAILFAVVIPLLVLASIVWLIVYLVRRNNNVDPGTPRPPAPPAPAVPNAAFAASAAGPRDATTAAVPPAPASPRTYTPAPPPRPRVPGPGRAGYLGTLALGILAAAAVAWTARVDQLAINPVLAWFALFLIGLGVVLMLVSVAGRKLGFLGFISVPLAFLGLIFGFYGDELRDAYEEARATIVVDWDEWDNDPGEQFADTGSVPIDATPAFTVDYSQVFFVPECYAGDISNEVVAGTPVARFAFAEFTEDVSLDIVAEYSEITVPAGTNIVLDAQGWAQSTVTWPARDVWCDFWDGDQRNFSLINPGAPTLTLTVYDDDHANTIIITETEAAAPVTEEVQP